MQAMFLIFAALQKEIRLIHLNQSGIAQGLL
jgi:hypothetical protein